jgi:hypothetical protein
MRHQDVGQRSRQLTRLATAALLAGVAAVGVGQLGQATAATTGTTVYLSPTGSDANDGRSPDHPVQSLQRAQTIVSTLDTAMSGDITVSLADGYYRLTRPLTLTSADSGTNGHTVIWSAASDARPVVAGSVRLTGWTKVGTSNIFVASAPNGLRTRQLYVAGERAQRATGKVPVSLTKTSTGYTASTSTMAGWRDPSGQAPPQVEFVYPGGLGAWTEPRCPIASMSGTRITMAQPCWANSNSRGTNHVGPASISSAPGRAENAYQLLTQPGQWYLDTGSSKVYYLPKSGQDMTTVDVEAPTLEALVNGGGTSTSPLHDVTFTGIQFSYATWNGASSPTGFSEVQANYLNQGSSPTSGNAQFNWTQIPANVTLTYDQRVSFTNDAFVHLGGAGLGLGDGTQGAVVKGDIVTDTSGNGIELGNVDKPTATGASQTAGNTISDNHVFNTPVEYRGGIGVDVGYAADTTLAHNQIDNLPYSGVSIGWGGWPDKAGKPGIANFSHGNLVSDNLIFNVVTGLGDGAAIYSNGQTGSSSSTGEHITGNVMHDMRNIFHMINTDNGTDWMTVTGNASWNTGPSNSWGYCHDDFYAGEGGGLDHENVTGNYWDNRAGNGSHGQLPTHSGNCNVSGNHDITSASQVPASLIAGAGLEPAYTGLLNWTQVPPQN